MTLFQYLALPMLACLLVLEVYRRIAGRDRGLANLLRFCLWLAAFAAIAWPDRTTTIARAIGISTGANLVLYLFSLAFLGTSFYFYSWNVRLQRQLTEVVRYLALESVQPPVEGRTKDEGRGTM